MAESKLAKFVEEIIVPPKMINVIVDGEVNEEYMRWLEILSKKLKFVEEDPLAKSSKALEDVEPELQKLRQKAISKVYFLSVLLIYFLCDLKGHGFKYVLMHKIYFFLFPGV